MSDFTIDVHKAIRPCSIDSCEGTHFARGWCHKHYVRWRKHGDPLYSMREETIKERFFRKCPQAPWGDECVEWTGSKNSDGYGVFSFAGRSRIASRVSFELHHGEIPDGHVIRHKCDNPPCVNPNHLETGTDAENSKDSVDRLRHAYGERQGSSKLTAAQVKEIRRIGKAMTLKQMAAIYGVHFSTIGKIRREDSWKIVN